MATECTFAFKDGGHDNNGLGLMAKYSLSIAATTILLVFAILSCSE